MVRGGIGNGGNGEAVGRAGKVDASGTVTALLQFGHGAVPPIWASVAERC